VGIQSRVDQEGAFSVKKTGASKVVEAPESFLNLGLIAAK